MNHDRRTMIAAASLLAAFPLTAHAASPMEGKPMSRLYPVLLAVIAAWKTQDVEGVLSHVTDDIVWQNSGGYAPAIQGKAAMREALSKMAPIIAESHWRIFDYAESETRLFMEGVDEFKTKDGHRVAIPYAGVLVFRGGLISEWREYFDGRLSALMKSSAGVPASVDALLARPVAK
jgi:limonene-1,2-epoxide hydrolase